MVEKINAVFKGGGAKGVAYAGALRACEEAGLKFAAVAGSSAGAITALLVACGYGSVEITEHLPKALRSVGHPAAAPMAITRTSLFSSRGLRRWLEGAVRAKITTAHPATFADVRKATGVDLYVVTMHVATGQPVVFSPDLTPAMPVVPAVVASSAIPVAFRPGRLAVGNDIHRLIDGGAWANYPAFVFTDREFRTHHGLPIDTGIPTYGFVLGDDQAPVDNLSTAVPVLGRSLASDRGAAARELRILGALLSSPIARLALVFVPLVYALLALDWLRDEATGLFPTLARIPDALEQLVLVAVVALLALGILVIGVVAAIALRLGAEFPDSGLMGAKAALGVGPSVPYWIGKSRTIGDHIVVRLTVPEQLGTLSFRPKQGQIDEAIRAAYDVTRTVLGGFQLPPSPPDLLLGERPVPASNLEKRAVRLLRGSFESPNRMQRIGRWIANSGLSLVVLFATLILSLELVKRLAVGSAVWWILPLLAVATAALVLLVARRRALRAGESAAFGDRSDRFVIIGAGVNGFLCLVLGGIAVFATSYSVIAESRARLISGEVLDVDVEDRWSYLDVELKDLKDEEVEALVRDPAGTLRSCDSSTACVTLATPTVGWETGDPVEVRADVARGVAFLESERWSPEHWNAFPYFASLAFLTGALFVDALETLARRRQLANADHSRLQRFPAPGGSAQQTHDHRVRQTDAKFDL